MVNTAPRPAMTRLMFVVLLAILGSVAPVLATAVVPDLEPAAVGNAAESLNCRYVGGWPFGMCISIDVDTLRELAFCGAGAGVYVLDVSDSTAPVKVSEGIHAAGLVSDLQYRQDLLYLAASRGGMEIWNVSVPTAPERLGDCSACGWAYRIRVQDSLAFVVSGDSGLVVVDVSDPMNPVVIGTHALFGGRAAAVRDTLAYVAADTGGLLILSVADPRHPYELSRIALRGRAVGVKLQDDYAFVADADSGLRIVDVSDSHAPWLYGKCSCGGLQDLEVQGEHVFGTGTSHALVVIRIPGINEPAPHVVARSTTPGYSSFLCVRSGRCYVAASAGGLVAYSVRDPGRPISLWRYDTPGRMRGLDARGGHVYVADEWNKFFVIDARDLAGMYEVGRLDGLDLTHSVQVEGQYAFVTDDTRSFHVVDVTVPSAPFLAGQCQYYGSMNDACVSGNYAFVANSYDGLRVVDISDPTNPRDTAGCGVRFRANAITCSNGYVSVAEEDYGLTVVDVNDPLHPYRTGMLDTPGWSCDVEVWDDCAYLADGPGGLRVIDVSDPRIPREVGSYDAGGRVTGVAVQYPYVYLAVGELGIQIVDVTRPDSICLVGYYGTHHYSRNLVVRSDTIYVSEECAGVHVYKGPLSDPSPRGAAGRPDRSPHPNATIVARNVLRMQELTTADLLDITGRRVMKLSRGENEVSLLSPGVYFLYSRQGYNKQPATKVIIRR